MANPSLTCVTPIYRDIETEEVGRVSQKEAMPSFDSNWLCIYFLVALPTGGTEVLASVNLTPLGADLRPIRFIEGGQNLTIAIDHDFLFRIGKKIHERFIPARNT